MFYRALGQVYFLDMIPSIGSDSGIDRYRPNDIEHGLTGLFVASVHRFANLALAYIKVNSNESTLPYEPLMPPSPPYQLLE